LSRQMVPDSSPAARPEEQRWAVGRSREEEPDTRSAAHRRAAHTPSARAARTPTARRPTARRPTARRPAVRSERGAGRGPSTGGGEAEAGRRPKRQTTGPGDHHQPKQPWPPWWKPPWWKPP